MLLERGEGREGVGTAARTARHGDRRRNIKANGLVCFPVVVVLPAHLGILCDLLPAVLAADKRTTHGTGDYTTNEHYDGGCQYDVRAPAQVRDEEQDVDDEGAETHQERDDSEHEKGEKIPRRVRWSVKVRSDGHDEHDQDEERCDWVEDENRRESVAHSFGHIEGIIVIAKGRACYVSVSLFHREFCHCVPVL